MFRWGHMLGFGVAAPEPWAADVLIRSMVHYADLPIYIVAATSAHKRLYRRFGFEATGPSYYGEVPMVCQVARRS